MKKCTDLKENHWWVESAGGLARLYYLSVFNAGPKREDMYPEWQLIQSRREKVLRTELLNRREWNRQV